MAMVYVRYFDLPGAAAALEPAPSAPQEAPARGWEMTLKFDNRKGCAACGAVQRAGTRGYWDAATKTMWHPACKPADVDAALAAAPAKIQQTPDKNPTTPVSVDIKDGIYTVVMEDAYRTIRIKTMKKGNLEGKRIVSYLSGCNNDTDYTGFAFLTPNGFQVWRKYQGHVNSELQSAIKVLANPAEAGQRYAIESGRCYLCGRTLTVEESIKDGIGPVCANK